MIHIGQKVQELVYKLDMLIVEFASRINKSRTVVYDIFTRETIDTGLLYKISEELEYNFFKLYFEDDITANDIPSKKYGKQSQEEILRELDSNKKRLKKVMEEISYLKMK